MRVEDMVEEFYPATIAPVSTPRDTWFGVQGAVFRV